MKRLANLQARSREVLVPLCGAMSVLGIVGDLAQADSAVQTAIADAQAYVDAAARLVLGHIGALTAEREKLLVLSASTLSSEADRPQRPAHTTCAHPRQGARSGSVATGKASEPTVAKHAPSKAAAVARGRN